MIKYDINLPRKDYNDLKENAVQDSTYQNGSKLNLKNNKPFLFLEVFNQLVSRYEDTRVRLGSKNAVLNIHPTRSSTKPMTIGGFCKLCDTNKAKNKYKLVINSFPADKKADIVVSVEREQEHSHGSAIDENNGSDSSEDEHDIFQEEAEAATMYAISQQAIANLNKRKRADEEKDNSEEEEEDQETRVDDQPEYRFAKNVRLEGQDRLDVADEIINKHGGQCKDYRDCQILKQKKEIDSGKY
jgi:hypothetical protein